MKRKILTLLFVIAANTGLVMADITIDGDFSDWAQLSGVNLAEASMDENSVYKSLYNIKFCCIDAALYFYAEYDANDVGPFSFCFDTDGLPSTGFDYALWEDAGVDYLFELGFEDGTYNPGLYKYVGSGQDDWSYDQVETGISTPFVVAELTNGHKAIEGKIANFATIFYRNNVPQYDYLKVGVYASTTEWAEIGCLPQATQDNQGVIVYSPMLQVQFDALIPSSCGDNLTWNYEDSVLTISGTGSMWDYSRYEEDLAPWYNLAIKSVVIGEGVTSIGEYAFYNCQWLTTVELPNTLSKIDDDAFRNCNALTTIQAHGIEPPSLYWSSFDGVNTSSVSVYVPFGSGSAYRSDSYWSGFNIIEPASGSGQCGENLTYTLVDGVLTITGTGEMYDYDYYNSRNRAPWSSVTVTAVTMAEGATSIGNSAFSSLDSITEFTIPSTVTRIGMYAFSGCSHLTSIHIPNGVTSIGGDAFYGCSSLTSITIPNGVTSIGRNAFEYCHNLTHLYIPASVEEIGDYCLVWAQKLAYLTAPASIFTVNDYVTSVEYYLSEYGPALPNKLDTLIINRGELDAFTYGSIALSNKTMRYMNLSATENTELPDEAFAHFYNLRSVVLPQGLQKLNYMALANCKSLESITIPASVQEIGLSAFENCYLLEEVIFDGNSSLTTIGNGAFYSCHELQRIAIPEGVTTIGKLAFYACTYLDEVELPASVRSLGDNAFAQCSRMKQMHVKAVVPPAIESKTFDQVSRLMPIYVPDASVAAYKADIYWGQMNIRSEDEPPTVSIFGQEVVIIDPEDSTIVAEVDVLGDSTLIYNTEENTLTFNGLTLEAGDSLSAAIRYVGSEPLTIVLVDSSAIIADTIISATANIIVRGDGYLAAEGVVPIIGVETATITFDSVNMYVHSLSSPAAVRRRIRGIKQLDETGGPALSGFASADFNKTAVTPPDAQYGEVEVEEAQGAPKKTINALYVRNSAGEKEVVTEFTLTALAEDDNAVENTIITRIASKQIIHGQLYFTLPDGTRYSATGVKVK